MRAPRPRRRGSVLVAVVVGLVVGGGGVGLGWALTSGHEQRSDAQDACEVFARTGQLTAHVDGATRYRLSAAAYLADGAKANDNRYTALAKAMDDIAGAFQAFALPSDMRIAQLVGRVEAACAGV
ncbi:MAG TPA: hypothetical protein VHF06_14745 [Pseudonocardiaceae bacterium]|nr:hypothetical protein [Pseudonocardiaceae bacterium]